MYAVLHHSLKMLSTLINTHPIATSDGLADGGEMLNQQLEMGAGFGRLAVKAKFFKTL